MPITINSDSNSRVSVNDNQELDLITNNSPRFRVETTGQIKAVYESQVGTDYNTTLHNGYLCRAWVRYNGSTQVITTSGNVSSITRNASTTGRHIITFTTAMPDGNYSVACMVGNMDYISVNSPRIQAISGVGTSNNMQVCIDFAFDSGTPTSLIEDTLQMVMVFR